MPLGDKRMFFTLSLLVKVLLSITQGAVLVLQFCFGLIWTVVVLHNFQLDLL